MQSANAPPPSGGILPGPPTLLRYLLATVLLVAGILVQYLPEYPALAPAWLGELFDGATTYGPGLVAFFLLLGVQPLRNAARRLGQASLEGLRWYGIMGALSLLFLIVLTIVYAQVYPNLDHILQRNTSVDQEGASDPWLWIALSFLVGLIEETLFRGFLFGAALMLFGTRRWQVHAVWTSLLFTSVHLYYGQTYGWVSPLFYLQIFFLGLAFCFAYFYSGGNLLVVALLHGLFDAISFSQFLPSVGVNGATALRYAFLGVACLVALLLWIRERGLSTDTTPLPPFAPPAAGTAPLAPPAPSAGVFPPTGSAPGTAPVPSEVPVIPGEVPPAVWPGVVAEPPPPHDASAPTASFVAPHCYVCGAIIVGDVRGLPVRCPRCGTPLGGPVPMAAPSTASAGGIVAVARPSPAPFPSSPFGRTATAGAARGVPVEHFEDLAAGVWPPPLPSDLPVHHFGPTSVRPSDAPKGPRQGGKP